MEKKDKVAKFKIILSKQFKEVEIEQDPDEVNQQDGIKIEYFIKTCQELKEKHPEVSHNILISIGIPLLGKNPFIDWNSYLKIMSIIRYHTITKEQSLDFWLKFLNPNQLPTIDKQDLYK